MGAGTGGRLATATTGGRLGGAAATRIVLGGGTGSSAGVGAATAAGAGAGGSGGGALLPPSEKVLQPLLGVLGDEDVLR
jgi:hypothetical protein